MIEEMKGHEDSVNQLCICNGDLYSCSDDNNIFGWDINSLQNRI